VPSSKAEFSAAFISFLNDPGIRIERPGWGAATLPEIFVYPDLVPFGQGAGTVSSSNLADPAHQVGAVLITGPEDSGKTSLLKSLAVKLLDAGYFPVYLDGREAPVSNPGDVPEAARTAAEAQYTAESSAIVNGPGSKKRALLFDNFDLAQSGELNPEALARSLRGEFALVILTASYPCPAFANSFSIAEMGRALRDELIRKWVLLRTSDPGEAASLAEKARGMVDAVLGKNIVPSYPVFVLTILESSVPTGSAGQAGSSYGHYYEYAVTKPLREGSTAAAEFDLYLAVLSELAYSRLAGGRAADKPEISGLVRRHAPEADPEDVIRAFVKSKTLRETGGAYEFASGYAYHYFAALYLSKNIGSGEVRDKIVDLFSRLGDGDNAGVALFLSYLSADPFVTEQIGKGVGRVSGEEALRTDEERESFIEELLAGLERDKPDELHEIRAEYRIRQALREFAQLSGGVRLASDRARLRETGALLRALTEALAAGHPGSTADSAYSLWTAHLSERLSEIDALRSGARVKNTEREEKLRLLFLYESAFAESLRLLSLLTASGVSIPEGPYSLAAALLKANPDTSHALRFAEENPEKKFTRRLIKIAAAESRRLFSHNPESEKELKGIAEGRFGKKIY
jgi:energy-coupling factor transporter ATP-binding protein EcfA2